jgi:dipeptidyl-peptidase-4
MLAQQGCIVMSVDNRGTPAPRGREWRKSVYRKIGVIPSEDQACAVRQLLIERPYMDADHIGIWGWSGGGAMTLNAMFRYPEVYRLGMAVAFVSNEGFYDTIYEERYMGLPSQNKEDYKNASAMTHASQLKGKLLLVHGTGDDNCHYQNCEALVNELIKHKKPFSMMSYPNRSHSISEGKNTRLHLFDTLTSYLKENLPLNNAR